MMSPVIIILSIICALLALVMLVAKNPVTSAISLLGILIMTAGIYGLIGEHMIATIQLVVYAGAIMVLFIFSIMLLNLGEAEKDFKDRPVMFLAGMGLGISFFALLGYAIYHHFHSSPQLISQNFDTTMVKSLGGNSKVLSHALFSQFYVSFEVISLALLIAIVGAVVLAKRKID